MRTLKVQAVTFDVGGTLIEPWPSVGHVYSSVAARHGRPGLDPADLNRRFASAWKALGSAAESRHEWRSVVRETFRPWPRMAESDVFFEALYHRFTEPSAWRIFPDSVPALDALREAGIRLGVVSNWDDRLRPLLDALGLARWFEVIVVSCEQGCRKPAPAMFHAASKRLALSPDAMLHVGDHEEQDVQGARRASMRGVQILRGGAASGPDRCLTLTEVPGLLMPD